jgi:hypothetical protein
MNIFVVMVIGRRRHYGFLHRFRDVESTVNQLVDWISR